MAFCSVRAETVITFNSEMLSLKMNIPNIGASYFLKYCFDLFKHSIYVNMSISSLVFDLLWKMTHHLPHFLSQTKPRYSKTEHTPITSLENSPTDTSNSGIFIFSS